MKKINVIKMVAAHLFVFLVLFGCSESSDIVKKENEIVTIGGIIQTTSSDEKLVIGEDIVVNPSTTAHSYPKRDEFSSPGDFYDFQKENSSKTNTTNSIASLGMQLIDDYFILIPANPLPNSSWHSVNTIEGVYIATRYKVEDEYANNFEDHSYAREMASEAAYILHFFPDTELALQSDSNRLGCETIEYHGNKYYVFTEYTTAGRKEIPVFYSISFSYEGRYVCVNLPASGSILEMLPHTEVKKLYSYEVTELLEVLTGEASSITSGSATLSGSYLNGVDNIEFGFCWGQDRNCENREVLGLAESSFHSSFSFGLEGLDPDTVYYFKAFTGGVVGDPISFMTTSGDIYDMEPSDGYDKNHDNEPYNDHVVETFSITFQPTDIRIYEGEEAVFSILVSGITDISYQWQSRDKNGEWINIYGAENMIYNAGATTLDFNEYQYRCVVSDDQRSVISDAVTLTVFALNDESDNKCSNCGLPGFNADEDRADECIYCGFRNRFTS